MAYVVSGNRYQGFIGSPASFYRGVGHWVSVGLLLQLLFYLALNFLVKGEIMFVTRKKFEAMKAELTAQIETEKIQKKKLLRELKHLEAVYSDTAEAHKLRLKRFGERWESMNVSKL